jgi:hypothetical protein
MVRGSLAGRRDMHWASVVALPGLEGREALQPESLTCLACARLGLNWQSLQTTLKSEGINCCGGVNEWILR